MSTWGMGRSPMSATVYGGRFFVYCFIRCVIASAFVFSLFINCCCLLFCAVLLFACATVGVIYGAPSMPRSVVVCIRDRALDAFGRPAFVPAIGAAIRSFTDEVNRKESEMHAHPDDYDLYHLGEFEDTQGVFVCEKAPALLVRGKDVFNPQE